MKHIKISAVAVKPDFQTVNVTVLEQTHRGYQFGKGSNRFVASNGFVLASVNCPQAGNAVAYLRGDNRWYDNTTVTMSTATFKKFKEAVEEYNRVFAAVPAPVLPKLSPCAVIIG